MHLNLNWMFVLHQLIADSTKRDALVRSIVIITATTNFASRQIVAAAVYYPYM